MKHHEYPKWLYSETQAPKLVQNEEEHGKLKGKWAESPADFHEKPEGEASEPTHFEAMTVAELKDFVFSKGAKDEEVKGMLKADLVKLAGSY